MASNKNLHNAKTAGYDEFYTQLTDIEKELKYYKSHFRGKTVYCNCDDPTVSNFWYYFSHQFERLGLKKLMATCYKNPQFDLFSDHSAERSFYLEYFGDKNGNQVPDPEEIEHTYLNGNGDFCNQECIELLKEADIVVTNPPFSLLRKYVAQLIEHNKKFLIIGPMNAITYKDIFPLIKSDQMWLGCNKVRIPLELGQSIRRKWDTNPLELGQSIRRKWDTNPVEVGHQSAELGHLL